MNKGIGLALIILITPLVVITASTLTFYLGYKPTSTSNNGELIVPPLETNLFKLENINGDSFSFRKGKWYLVYFDNFNDLTLDKSVKMLESVANTYLQSYIKIIKLRQNRSFSLSNKAFQEYRRGRYAEFNLLYDRGTSFGLQSGGRIESILASLPPMTSWIYNKDNKFKKYEENLLFILKKRWRG